MLLQGTLDSQSADDTFPDDTQTSEPTPDIRELQDGHEQLTRMSLPHCHFLSPVLIQQTMHLVPTVVVITIWNLVWML